MSTVGAGFPRPLHNFCNFRLQKITTLGNGRGDPSPTIHTANYPLNYDLAVRVSEDLFYSSILSNTRSITPGMPPRALIVRVYGFMGIPKGLKRDIIRSQQKRAESPEITESVILPRLSLLSIKITRKIPEKIRRIKRRFILSPFNFMLVPIKKCIFRALVRLFFSSF